MSAKHGPSAVGAMVLWSLLISADCAHAQVRFSEFLFNPTGVPVGRESIEILNTNNGPISLFGFSILVIDGAAGSTGNLVETYSIPSSTVIPAGALLLIRDSATPLAPAPAATTIQLIHDFSVGLGGSSKTFVLGFGSAPPAGIDVDLNDDGVLDVNTTNLYHVVDAVAVIDNVHPGDVGYADDLGFENLGPFNGPNPLAHTPEALYRFFNADLTPCAWAGGEILGSPPGPFAFDIVGNSVFGFAEQGLSAQGIDLGLPNVLPDLNGNGIANGCDATLEFEGLPHAKLGGAVMSIAGTNLLLQNIGGSGMDGVAVALGQVESHRLVVGLPDSVNPSSGAVATFVPVGRLGGMDNQPLWSLALTDNGPDYAVSLDASAVNPASVRVEALLAGSVVVVADHAAPLQVGLVLASLAAADIDVEPFRKVLGAAIPQYRATLHLPAATSIDVAGAGGAVLADELRIAALLPAVMVGPVASTRLLGVDLGSFTIHDEAVGYFTHDHEVLGNTSLLGTVTELSLLGFGPSGQDGVSVSLGELRPGIHLGVAPLDLTPGGRSLDVLFTGSLGGVPVVSLLQAGITSSSATLDVSVDATFLAPLSLDVIVYDHGDAVGTVNLPASAGVVANVSSAGGPVLLSDLGMLPPLAPGFDLVFTGLVNITPSGSPTLLGDELRVVAVSPAAPVDGVTSFQLFGTQLSGLSLNCESGYNVTEYGHGCPGTGGFVPRLRVTGCPQANQKITLEIDRALAGSVSFVFIGVNPVELALAGGCTLNVFPVLALIPVFLNGVGPGSGNAKFTTTVPPAAATATVALQVFDLDLNANFIGATSSNGVLVFIDP